MTADHLADSASAALAAGDWRAARAGFEAALTQGDSADARFGLAMALWWLGDNQGSVQECTRAYTLYRRRGEAVLAAQCAGWLTITYKANFANAAAANGWARRAERLLQGRDIGPDHAWIWVARAYRMDDLDQAAELTEAALAVARAAGDVDLELVALSQSGLITVGRGQPDAGLAMIDEALAAALGGEGFALTTVAYACCDMLSACELAGDGARAAQWCQVADGFVDRYGCPFLYAECRICYGALLTAQGRWADAARELSHALRITEDGCPGLHAQALTRLADLRIRQGRLEEAGWLLTHVHRTGRDDAQTSVCRAAYLLARGEPVAAGAELDWRLEQLAAHPVRLAEALAVLTDVELAVGNTAAARASAARLADLAERSASDPIRAMAGAASGRVLLARQEWPAAATALETATVAWTRLDRPLEAARAREHWARSLSATFPDAATEQARRARSAFGALGASLDADRVSAWLRSLGVRTPPGPRGMGVLSAREREVLALVSAGLSNPQIAQRLHLSRKTVAHHVSAVLAKLHLHNRAEAAVYAVAASERAPQVPLGEAGG